MDPRTVFARFGFSHVVAGYPRAGRVLAAALVAVAGIGVIGLKAAAGRNPPAIETAALTATQDTVTEAARDTGLGRALFGKDDGRVPGTPLALSAPRAPIAQAPAPTKAQQAPARSAAVHSAPRRSTGIIGIQ